MRLNCGATAEWLKSIGQTRSQTWKTFVEQKIWHLHRTHSETERLFADHIRVCRGRKKCERQTQTGICYTRSVTQVVKDLGCHSYSEMKKLAEDRKTWRTAAN